MRITHCAAQEIPSARGEMGAERQRRQEQQGVGQVQGEINRSLGGTVIRRELEKHKQSAQQGLIEGEHGCSDDAHPGQMFPRRGAEGPYQQCQNGDHRDAARHPMGKLNDGGDSRMGLNDHAVAQRPMIAAAGSRSGGPDQPSPKDHGDVVSQHAPRKAAEKNSPSRQARFRGGPSRKCLGKTHRRFYRIFYAGRESQGCHP